jgi:hypothetical protein
MTLLASIEDYLSFIQSFIQHEQGVNKTTFKSYHTYL